MKTCTKCLESKEDSEFYLIKRPPPRKPTLYRHCKACHSKMSKDNAEYSKNWELKKKYGITLDEYKEQVSLRDNLCDICSSFSKPLHVDHNHTTGKVRGYLCGSCNRAIGLLKDNSGICREAAGYLEKHGD